MFISMEDLPEIFFQAACFFCIYFIFYRKNIYSIFDPLFQYVYTLAFSSVLVIYMLWEKQPQYAYHFFWCQLFFFIGFFLTTYKAGKVKNNISFTDSPKSFSDYKTFRIILYILCAFYFLTNVVLFYTKGFALLSDDPSEAKVENFTKGFGIIHRINKSVGGFVLIGIFFCLYYKPKPVDYLLLLISIVLNSLSGAKSAFAGVAYVAVLVAYHPLFRSNKKIASTLKLMAPLGVLGILVVSFTVFLKESADSEDAILKFVLRLLYGADSILYFYQPANEIYFAQFHFWDYPGYLFNSFLVMFRLVPGIEANGNTMVLNIIQNQSQIFSGPNTPYYIEGQIFFGYYGAFIYSAFIGACLAFSRHIFFNKSFLTAFNFVFAASIMYQASVISIEMNAGFTKVLETYFFVIPVYIFVNLVVNRRVSWKKIRFRKLYSTPQKL